MRIHSALPPTVPFFRYLQRVNREDYVLPRACRQPHEADPPPRRREPEPMPAAVNPMPRLGTIPPPGAERRVTNVSSKYLVEVPAMLGLRLDLVA